MTCCSEKKEASSQRKIRCTSCHSNREKISCDVSSSEENKKLHYSDEINEIKERKVNNNKQHLINTRRAVKPK